MRLIATGLALAVLVHAQAAKPVRIAGIDPVFRKHGIKIERADESEAAVRLGRLVGEEAAGKIHPLLKPYVLLVQNGSGMAIEEIHAVLYRYPAAGSEGIPAISSMKLGPGAVAPGDFFIVGEGGLTQALMGKSKHGLALVGLAESQAAFIGSNLDGRRFQFAEAVIHAMVLADGRVLGPDRTGVVEQQRAALEAMKDVLAKLQDSSVTDTALNEWLATVSARRAQIKPNGMPDHAKSQLAGLISFARRQLPPLGRERLAQHFVRMIGAKTAEVHNLIPVNRPLRVAATGDETGGAGTSFSAIKKSSC